MKIKYIEATANMNPVRKPEQDIVTTLCVRMERMQMLTRNGKTKKCQDVFKVFSF